MNLISYTNKNSCEFKELRTVMRKVKIGCETYQFPFKVCPDGTSWFGHTWLCWEEQKTLQEKLIYIFQIRGIRYYVREFIDWLLYLI